MKFKKIIPLFLVTLLSSCSVLEKYHNEYLYIFGTFVSYEMKLVNKKPLSDTKKILNDIDLIADSFQMREGINVYSLNHTNEKLQINKELYDLLNTALSYQKENPLFNPLVGNLSEYWKSALSMNRTLTDDAIKEQLEIINSSSLVISEDENGYYAQRIGDAKIDLGAITKGYAIDRVYNQVLKDNGPVDYVINAGRSSVLLGTNTNTSKKNNLGYDLYLDGIGTNLTLQNCVVSTSSIFQQSYYYIDDTCYAHIVNPLTGNAIALHDCVIIISQKGEGALGDFLSTVSMLSTLDEIKVIESKYNVQVAAFRSGIKEYASPGLKIDNYYYYY